MSITLIELIANLLLKYGPAVAESFVRLFHAKEPTLEMWLELFALAKRYEDYDPTLEQDASAPPAP